MTEDKEPLPLDWKEAYDFFWREAPRHIKFVIIASIGAMVVGSLVTVVSN